MTQAHTCIHCGRDDSQVPVVVFFIKTKNITSVLNIFLF